MDEEASENNIEDANPIERIMLFTAVGWSHFDEALLWLPARQLIGKMFSSRKGHIQICFNEIQKQSEMGLLSTKTIQTLPRLEKTNEHHPILTIHQKELRSHQIYIRLKSRHLHVNT